MSAQEGGQGLNTAGTGYGSLFDTNEFVLKKKIMSLREHYDIEDKLGNKIVGVDGNYLQVPTKFVVINSHDGSETMRIEGKMLSMHDQFSFKDPTGSEFAVIRKKIATLVHDQYWLEQNGKEVMRIYGDFMEHEYSMQANNQQVALVHKKWVSLADQYCISILADVDRRLVIGATIVIEHIEVTKRSH